jgi:hypothetical protein
MFGGSSGGPLSDTQEWDGANWIRRAPATIPAPRNGHSLVYDPFRERSILFGGCPGNNDTWEWNGTNWLEMHPAAARAPPLTPASAMRASWMTLMLLRLTTHTQKGHSTPIHSTQRLSPSSPSQLQGDARDATHFAHPVVRRE